MRRPPTDCPQELAPSSLPHPPPELPTLQPSTLFKVPYPACLLLCVVVSEDLGSR